MQMFIIVLRSIVCEEMTADFNGSLSINHLTVMRLCKMHLNYNFTKNIYIHIYVQRAINLTANHVATRERAAPFFKK
jgi:hypothetical protein